MSADLLNVEGLWAGYGEVTVLRDVSLRVAHGEVVALLGPNGAGKTTLLRVVSGLIPAASGRVTFEGSDLRTTPAFVRARRGMLLVPEGRHVFPRLTVEENLLLGAWRRGDWRGDLERVYELFPALQGYRKRLAAGLSGGEQQMLALGRALMRGPRLLLLDEPSMGLAPTVVQRVFGLIHEINALGVTVLLIEQNANMALQVAGRAYVLERGAIATEGSAERLRRDESVRVAYLGGAPSSG